MSGLRIVSFGELDAYCTEHPGVEGRGGFVVRVRAELVCCDECGRQADAVHFLGADRDWPENHRPVRVLFSCRRHDFGGYWLNLADLTSGRTLTHVAEKRWGLHAIAALNDRLDQLDDAAFDVWLQARRSTAA